MTRGSTPIALVALVLIAACDSEAKTSARSLLDAVSRFRAADDGEKLARAPLVAASPCASEDVCRAKEACVAFVEPTAAALRMKIDAERSVRQRREEGTLDATAAAELLRRVDEAEAQLQQGRERLPRCDDELMTLKRRYGI